MDATSIIPALTALAAVVLGPVVSLYVVRRQFAAQVLSTNRQQWINTLRDRLADLIGFIAHYSATKAVGHLDDVKSLSMQRTAYANWVGITLLINRNEQDHVQLVAEIESVLEFLFQSPANLDPGEVRSRLDRVIVQAQIVLKREWERVKRGK